MKKIKSFWNKGKWQKVVVVFVCLVVLSCLSGALNGNKKTASTSKEEIKEEVTDKKETKQETTQEEQKQAEPQLTLGQKNALDKAKSYLKFSAFSYNGLIDQLKYEGFTDEECTFAVDSCGADWNEQALKKAKSYLDYTAFSYTGLIDQLKYEKFTDEQATYGANNCGADWNEQAAKKAQSYLEENELQKTVNNIFN